MVFKLELTKHYVKALDKAWEYTEKTDQKTYK